jgi:hypothetical protein
MALELGLREWLMIGLAASIILDVWAWRTVFPPRSEG